MEGKDCWAEPHSVSTTEGALPGANAGLTWNGTQRCVRVTSVMQWLSEVYPAAVLRQKAALPLQREGKVKTKPKGFVTEIIFGSMREDSFSYLGSGVTPHCVSSFHRLNNEWHASDMEGLQLSFGGHLM